MKAKLSVAKETKKVCKLYSCEKKYELTSIEQRLLSSLDNVLRVHVVKQPVTADHQKQLIACQVMLNYVRVRTDVWFVCSIA